jgi:hypothetical protein
MSCCVVDTNVPIVANGGADPGDARPPSVVCRIGAVIFLRDLLDTGRVLLDLEGLIQEEYRRYLRPSGQPGVGDRFYQVILHSSPLLVERVDLPKRPDGEYADLPQSLIDKEFDPSDRKFAALARCANVSIFHATDRGWIDHAETLAAEGIQVEHLCGCNKEKWFTP